MIEATCTACGNINRVGETDIPVGAKFVNCASCKSRVAIPTKTSLGASPPKIPAPPPLPAAKTETLGLADLPAPKRSSPLGAEASKPVPRSGLAAALDSELPAPRGPARPAAVPAPSSGSINLDDLLPPGAELGGHSDLPAPKGASARSATSAKAELSDLPAPKAPRPEPPRVPPAIPILADLPAPRSNQGVSDLPAPKRAGAAARPAPPDLDSILDLPTPKPGGISDLPTPKVPAGVSDLPTPKGPSGIIDLPTPKRPSGIVDLPMPKPGGASDLPAPKGFFDDLPQPASAAAQQQNQARAADLPAPKGFFDDLPGRPNASKAAKPELPAPKGFFEDLPGRVNPNKQVPAEVPAPKGFFDDLPGRVNPNKPVPAEVPAPKGFFDDLPQPSRARFDSPKQQTEPPPLALDIPIDTGPALDLDTPPATQFDDLDLSAPSTPQAVHEAKQRSAASEALPSITLKKGDKADTGLELEEPRVAKPTPKLAKRTKAPSTDPDAVRARARRARILGLVLLALVALGAGGFFLYRRHVAKQEAEEKVSESLAKARKALASSESGHWDKAYRAANVVLEVDDKNPEALGIVAEAELASGLANGVAAQTKFTKGRNAITKAVGANVSNPELVRAQALSAIVANQPDRAIEKLKPLSSAAPTNATLALYLGWAYAANGDAVQAIAAFDLAAKGTDEIKVFALYERGRAKLARADLAGAREDFAAVLAIAKTHVGAQVGLTAAQPASQGQQTEADLLAIVARKDLDTEDPRAVIHAWVLAAEIARRGNRFDAARERYRKALALAPEDLPTLTGLAEVEVRDGKLDAAAELLKKALQASPTDIHAALVMAELSILNKDLADAGTRLTTLAARKPPPPIADQAQIQLMTGRLLDAQGDEEAALESYLAAAKLAGDLDLTPTLAAVAKLTSLADKASQAKDGAKATQLRLRAGELLASLADNAQKDPQLALTLGISYLQADDPEKAEPWLRRVVDARPSDLEGQYQLAKALARLGRTDEAIRGLQKAIDIDPNRTEIGLELARTYEAANRDRDAGPLYTKLLETAKDPSVELRARAGRFFVRTGEIAKGAEQGQKILAVVPNHAAGLYLKAEGLLAAGRIDEARKMFTQAVDLDRDAQYLDGQGRAAEAQALKDNDSRFQDTALRAYMAAVEKAPTMFNPYAGQGRLYVVRHEAAKAVIPLLAAYKLQEDAEVAYNLGLAYKELQQVPTAIQWFNKSIQLRPNAEASWNLGQVLFDANQGKQSAAALEAATRGALDEEKRSGKTVPWLTDALYKLGAVQVLNHNDNGARDAWEKYVARNPAASAQLTEAKRALATNLRRN